MLCFPVHLYGREAGSKSITSAEIYLQNIGGKKSQPPELMTGGRRTKRPLVIERWIRSVDMHSNLGVTMSDMEI